MQRYRVNYKLLVGLVIGGLATAGVSYGLWWYQVDSNAKTLRDRAKIQEDAGEKREALLTLEQYVALRPDDEQALIDFGHLAAEIAKDFLHREWSYSDVFSAINVLSNAVTKTEIWKSDTEQSASDREHIGAENAKLRRELVDNYMRIGKPNQALTHVEALIKDSGGPNPETDAELIGLQLQCLESAKLQEKALNWSRIYIGFNEDTGEFEDTAPQQVPENLRAYWRAAPHSPDAYWKVARDLKIGGVDVDKDVARRVIDKMVSANPESAQAWTQQHQFLLSIFAEQERIARSEESQALDLSGTPKARAESRAAEARKAAESAREEARVALENAFAIDPDDLNVLYSEGQQRIRDYQHIVRATHDLLGPESTNLLDELMSVSVVEAEGILESRSIPPQLQSQVTENLAKAQNSLNEAIKYFDAGIEAAPDNQRFYELAASARLSAGKLDEALKVTRKGLDSFGLPRGLTLSNRKVDILLKQNTPEALAEIKREIELLRDTDIITIAAIADLHQARLLMLETSWAGAEKLLIRVRRQLESAMDNSAGSELPRLAANAGLMLGSCHEKLGRLDEALRDYKQVFERYGTTRARQRYLAVANRLGVIVAPEQGGDASTVFAGILRQPVNRRDWKALEEAIDRWVRTEEITEAHALILKAQIRNYQAAETNDQQLRQSRFAEVRELIDQALDSSGDRQQTLWLATALLASDPEGGAERALDRLLKAIESGDLPDNARTRERQAQLIVAVGGNDVSAQLSAFLDGMEEWATEYEQSTLLSAIGSQFLRIGDNDRAWELMERSVALAPNDLPTRRRLFDVALQMQDAERLDQAQQLILDFVGDETNPDYVLTVAKRRILESTQRLGTADQLKETQASVAAAMKRRPDWHELQLVGAQIELMLGGDSQKALDLLRNAAETGPLNTSAIALQVKILAVQERFDEALRQMQLIPESSRVAVLGRLAAEIYRKLGDSDAAFKAAEEHAKARPDDPSAQLWFAEFARDVGGEGGAERLDTAENSLLKMAETDPSNVMVWEQLVRLYVQKGDIGNVTSTLRKAQLWVDEDMLPQLMAKSHEIFRRWQQAEKLLLSLYAHRLGESFANRQLGQFYLNWANADDADPLAAAPYINHILAAVDAGELEAAHDDAAWARRSAANLLFKMGGYQNSLKAERLLNASLEVDVGAVKDMGLLVSLLTRRGDPDSFAKAAVLLQRLKGAQGLDAKRSSILGQVLFQLGRWEECQMHMEDAVGRFPKDAALQADYATMLVAQEDYRQAERVARRLKGIAGAESAGARLEVTLAAAQDDMARVRNLLKQLTPRNRTTESSLKIIPSVIKLAERAGDYQFAIALCGEYVKSVPSAKLDLARLEANHGKDAKLGLAMLEQLSKDENFDLDEVLVEVVAMYRRRKEEVGDALDVRVNSMVRSAIRRDTESARRLLARAEVLGIQQRHDEAVAAYEKLLARNDLPKVVQATALNNFAFLIATADRTDKLDDALAAANQAAELLGPLSDVLDTRAVVHLARGDFEQALHDMELAVQMGPTAAKYFHLAKAQWESGQRDNALQSWREAVKLGIGPENIPQQERDAIRRFSTEIEALETASAQG